MGASAAMLNAAYAMAVDRVTAEVVTELRANAVDAILLKGPAIAEWLYPEGGRGYGDTDLLVSPARFDVARRVLESRGFALAPTDVPIHAFVYVRHDPATGRAFVVDLHQRLPHLRRSAIAAWAVLRAETVEMTVGGVAVQALSLPARALHVVLHAVQHAHPKPKPLEDLRRAVAMVDLADWRRALDLARALGAEDLAAAGLRMVPEGAALADELGLPKRVPLVLRLRRNGGIHAWARELQRLGSSRTRGERRFVLREGVLPSADVMRAVAPLARRGSAGLFLAHVVRIARSARRALMTLRTRPRAGTGG